MKRRYPMVIALVIAPVILVVVLLLIYSQFDSRPEGEGFIYPDRLEVGTVIASDAVIVEKTLFVKFIDLLQSMLGSPPNGIYRAEDGSYVVVPGGTYLFVEIHVAGKDGATEILSPEENLKLFQKEFQNWLRGEESPRGSFLKPIEKHTEKYSKQLLEHPGGPGELGIASMSIAYQGDLMKALESEHPPTLIVYGLDEEGKYRCVVTSLSRIL